jgi:hypothetical protein
VHAFELAVAGLFGVAGLLSLRKWLGAEFRAASLGEQLLYTLHTTARVGMWFAFAGFFVGYALVANPTDIRWYLLVPLGLAGVQLLTAVILWLSPPAPPGPGRSGGDGTASREGLAAVSAGKTSGMGDTKLPPGPLEPDKEGATADPGHPQPEAAEVESARLLANQSRAALHEAGLTDREITRLADDFIAQDRSGDLAKFIEWAKARAGAAR